MKLHCEGCGIEANAELNPGQTLYHTHDDGTQHKMMSRHESKQAEREYLRLTVALVNNATTA